jgi:3'(2'), 5'-bisphosphate nucleotidase
VSDDARILDVLEGLAARASAVVLQAYAGDIRAEYKSPGDPVTEVDRRVNELLVQALMRDFPGVPIVAEESDAATFAGRAQGDAFFVDPIDGTREFIDKNGEFCVMIGLARGGRAALGVIDCPATGRVIAGSATAGSFERAKDGSRAALRASVPTGAMTVAVSRSRFGARTREALAKLGEVVPRAVGSAGIKTMLVCTGEAHAYVHLGRAGCLWDACAGDAIAQGAGAVLTSGKGAPIDYRDGPIELTDGVIVAEAGVHASILARLGD